MSQLGLFPGNVRDLLAAYAPAVPSSPSTYFRPNQPRNGLYDSASDAGQVALATGVMRAEPVAVQWLFADRHGAGHHRLACGQDIRPVRRPHLITAARGRRGRDG
jgi:hypothetical protein